MTMNKEIARVIRLEKRAQKLSLEMDILQSKWETAIEKAGESSDWIKYCNEQGFSVDYKWGDVLA